MIALRLSLFGGFKAATNDGLEIRLPRNASKILLAYLALNPGIPHGREKLAALLWSESDDREAKASLRQALTSLLHALSDDGGTILSIERQSISLISGSVASDVGDFLSLARSRLEEDWERAAGLYRGALLEGLTTRHEACEDWISGERASLKDVFLDILEKLLAARITANSLEPALQVVEQIIAHDAFNEDAQRAKIALLYRLGRRGSALRHYQDWRRSLARELGVEPDIETQRLHAEMRYGAQTHLARDKADREIGLPFVASRRPDPDAIAHDCEFMARALYHRGMDRRNLEIASALFGRAIERDSLFASAYAGLAICGLYLSIVDAGRPHGSAHAAASRALELAPQSAEAHAANGLALFAAGRLAEAEESFERGLRLDPDCFEANLFSARLASARNQHERAARLFERCALLRPRDYRTVGLMADELALTGREGEFGFAARRCHERLSAELELHPDNADAWAFGSTVVADLGDTQAAAEWARRAMLIDPAANLVQFNCAQAFALAGEDETAFNLMERALSGLSLSRLLAWMALDARIEVLKDNPRYHALKEMSAKN
jgi:DNA-binding SARP family transcriptional activator